MVKHLPTLLVERHHVGDEHEGACRAETDREEIGEARLLLAAESIISNRRGNENYMGNLEGLLLTCRMHARLLKLSAGHTFSVVKHLPTLLVERHHAGDEHESVRSPRRRDARPLFQRKHV